MRWVVEMLLVVGGLLPLAAMLASLFAAVWIREGWRTPAAAPAPSRFDST